MYFLQLSWRLHILNTLIITRFHLHKEFEPWNIIKQQLVVSPMSFLFSTIFNEIFSCAYVAMFVSMCVCWTYSYRVCIMHTNELPFDISVPNLLSKHLHNDYCCSVCVYVYRNNFIVYMRTPAAIKWKRKENNIESEK